MEWYWWAALAVGGYLGIGMAFDGLIEVFVRLELRKRPKEKRDSFSLTEHTDVIIKWPYLLLILFVFWAEGPPSNAQKSED